MYYLLLPYNIRVSEIDVCGLLPVPLFEELETTLKSGFSLVLVQLFDTV